MACVLPFDAALANVRDARLARDSPRLARADELLMASVRDRLARALSGEPSVHVDFVHIDVIEPAIEKEDEELLARLGAVKEADPAEEQEALRRVTELQARDAQLESRVAELTAALQAMATELESAGEIKRRLEECRRELAAEQGVVEEERASRLRAEEAALAAKTATLEKRQTKAANLRRQLKRAQAEKLQCFTERAQLEEKLQGDEKNLRRLLDANADLRDQLAEARRVVGAIRADVRKVGEDVAKLESGSTDVTAIDVERDVEQVEEEAAQLEAQIAEPVYGSIPGEALRQESEYVNIDLEAAERARGARRAAGRRRRQARMVTVEQSYILKVLANMSDEDTEEERVLRESFNAIDQERPRPPRFQRKKFDAYFEYINARIERMLAPLDLPDKTQADNEGDIRDFIVASLDRIVNFTVIAYSVTVFQQSSTPAYVRIFVRTLPGFLLTKLAVGAENTTNLTLPSGVPKDRQFPKEDEIGALTLNGNYAIDADSAQRLTDFAALYATIGIDDARKDETFAYVIDKFVNRSTGRSATPIAPNRIIDLALVAAVNVQRIVDALYDDVTQMDEALDALFTKVFRYEEPQTEYFALDPTRQQSTLLIALGARPHKNLEDDDTFIVSVAPRRAQIDAADVAEANDFPALVSMLNAAGSDAERREIATAAIEAAVRKYKSAKETDATRTREASDFLRAAKYEAKRVWPWVSAMAVFAVYRLKLAAPAPFPVQQATIEAPEPVVATVVVADDVPAPVAAVEAEVVEMPVVQSTTIDRYESSSSDSEDDLESMQAQAADAFIVSQLWNPIKAYQNKRGKAEEKKADVAQMKVLETKKKALEKQYKATSNSKKKEELLAKIRDVEADIGKLKTFTPSSTDVATLLDVNDVATLDDVLDTMAPGAPAHVYVTETKAPFSFLVFADDGRELVHPKSAAAHAPAITSSDGHVTFGNGATYSIVSSTLAPETNDTIRVSVVRPVADVVVDDNAFAADIESLAVAHSDNAAYDIVKRVGRALIDVDASTRTRTTAQLGKALASAGYATPDAGAYKALQALEAEQ